MTTTTNLPAAFTENSSFAQACIDGADADRVSDVQACLRAEGEALDAYAEAAGETEAEAHARTAKVRVCSACGLADPADCSVSFYWRGRCLLAGVLPVRNFASYEEALGWVKARLDEGNGKHVLMAELRECSFLNLTDAEACAVIVYAEEELGEAHAPLVGQVPDGGIAFWA